MPLRSNASDFSIGSLIRVVPDGKLAAKKKNSETKRRAALEKINDYFVARMGTTLSELATIRRAEKTAERGKYEALEQVRHNITRARDAVIAQCK